MPVSTLKPEVADYLDVWQMMRDVIGGSRTIKAAGTKYLPMLSKMTQVDYENYKMRADYYDGTSRASMAMVGFLFRKPPEINVADNSQQMQDFQDDATLTGKSLYDFIKDASQQIIDTGRAGVWVDWNDEENRPYAMLYEAQDIINWQHTRIAGKMVLTRLVLHECVDEENPKDSYAIKKVDQWREFELGDDGNVTITVWRKKKTKQSNPAGAPGNVIGNALTGSMKYLFGTGTSVTTGSEEDYEVFTKEVPDRGGQPLGRILFTFLSTDGPYPEITKPPLYGMADLNVSWYRTSADLENARHFVGVPTPYFAGFITDGKPSDITLGSSRVLSTTETGAHCGFLQVTDNFACLTEGLKEKKIAMGELGVYSIIDANTTSRAPEAYATIALRTSAQSSGLTAIARALSQSLTDTLTFAAWYAGTAPTPEELTENTNVKMNLDFMAETLQSGDIATLVAAFVQGGISYETLFYNLQSGEIIEDGVTIEEERARLLKDKKLMLAAPAVPGQPAAPGAPPAKPPVAVPPTKPPGKMPSKSAAPPPPKLSAK